MLSRFALYYLLRIAVLCFWILRQEKPKRFCTVPGKWADSPLFDFSSFSHAPYILTLAIIYAIPTILTVPTMSKKRARIGVRNRNTTARFIFFPLLKLFHYGSAIPGDHLIDSLRIRFCFNSLSGCFFMESRINRIFASEGIVSPLSELYRKLIIRQPKDPVSFCSANVPLFFCKNL